ncbi:MAG: hypothetical protein LQ348_000201 [Seirophora lacunosa]|nr:MAG: hypothetical protein LQ348_000201 [Seirophora lacunosa]
MAPLNHGRECPTTAFSDAVGPYMNIFAMFMTLCIPPSRPPPPKLLVVEKPRELPPYPPIMLLRPLEVQEKRVISTIGLLYAFALSALHLRLIGQDKVLDISPNATQQQVRDAYKKHALKSHPDRVPSDSPERPARTKKFQQINDAYYTLSDPSRRRDYDYARSFHSFSESSAGDSDPEEEEIPRPKAPRKGGFPWSSFGFGAKNEHEEENLSNEQFGSVFEEMLRDEGLAEGQEAKPTGKFWSLIGGLSGGAMGFIVANFPGALAGAVAGNRLGAVRDARGKSVYSVFQELPQGDKAKLLSELAAKVFAHAISS